MHRKAKQREALQLLGAQIIEMRSQKNVENNLHRSQALKLNEMYSSYSFLKEIYEMHADFISTFERLCCTTLSVTFFSAI